VQGIRGIAQYLGADDGVPVVLIDTREELNIYLRGQPYSRRDRDMPMACIHDTGIHWRELAKLEDWLLEDTKASGREWSIDGLLRVLVHHEATVRLSQSYSLDNVLINAGDHNYLSIDTVGRQIYGCKVHLTTLALVIFKSNWLGLPSHNSHYSIYAQGIGSPKPSKQHDPFVKLCNLALWCFCGIVHLAAFKSLSTHFCPPLSAYQNRCHAMLQISYA
jgi:hypothetical protein